MGIHQLLKLLYIEGYTISGACNQLSATSAETSAVAGSNGRLSDQDIDGLVVELEEIAQLLRA